jgi:peptide/nickel transport system substrate-binding protein
VILEKLPNLADGDAVISVVTVGEGDRVVEADGAVVTLDPSAAPPILLVPAGGGEPVPYQGGGFEMEQLSATFRLWPGLLWSDGEPLTAADSAYAFNLLADPDTPLVKFKIERTASYQATDERTTVWTGLPGFLDPTYSTNFFGPAPEHLWGKYSAAELLEAEESRRKPVGWGPYVIDEWISGESISLHRNPNYFRAAEGLPRFDTLVFRIVGENTDAMLASLLSGECDILDNTIATFDQTPLLLDLQSSGKLKVTFATGTNWFHLDFGIQPIAYDDGYQVGIDRPDFFSDVRTRQAIAMCIDRQALVDTILFGQSLVVDTYLPPQHPLFNPDVQHYDFDAVRGNALLEEAGWVDEDNDRTTPRLAQGIPNVPDGTPFVVSYMSRPISVFEQIAAVVSASLAECGIQLNIQTYPTEEIFGDGPEGPLFGRQFDLAAFTWLTGVEPPCDLYLSTNIPGPAGENWVSVQDGVERTFSTSGWGGQNNPGFVNEEYDRACSTGLGKLPGQAAYETAHLEAQRIFAEQLPVVPLFLDVKLAVTRPNMCGFIMDPSNNTGYWNIEEFDYGEGCEE